MLCMQPQQHEQSVSGICSDRQARCTGKCLTIESTYVPTVCKIKMNFWVSCWEVCSKQEHDLEYTRTLSWKYLVWSKHSFRVKVGPRSHASHSPIPLVRLECMRPATTAVYAHKTGSSSKCIKYKSEFTATATPTYAINISTWSSLQPRLLPSLVLASQALPALLR